MMVLGDLWNSVILILVVVSGGRRVCSGDVVNWAYTWYILLGLRIGLRLCVGVIVVTDFGGRCMLADLLSNENESSARVESTRDGQSVTARGAPDNPNLVSSACRNERGDAAR